MAEIIRNAMAMAGVVLVATFAGAVPALRWWGYLSVVAGAIGVGFLLGVLDARWVVESLGADLPWGGVGALLLWSLLARSGVLRPRGWPAAVGLAALAGDLFVATALAATETDSRRRARLVLAASAASLVGPAGGAGALALGWGGWELAAVGLGLALVGVVGGETGVRRGPVDRSALPFAAAVALGAGVMAWLAAASGALDFLAQGIERAPLEFPDEQGALVVGVGLLLGAFGDEGTIALCFQGALDRALSVREPMVAPWLMAGLGIGNGLPLLVATRSSLRVGLPLWLLQGIGVLAWAWLR